ncbi:PadR family transcriptional regulator [Streptomyces sp. NPDC001502]|uniref:PadR family transcriptional regulator n=1 Tax=Streptomyces sp. NPDC001502 TaxID=3364578 RepID=UPI0036816363
MNDVTLVAEVYDSSGTLPAPRAGDPENGGGFGWGIVFYVLTAPADEPRHGYGVVTEAAALSEGQVRLPIGTLYGVLDRLAAEGVIELDREEAHQGRLRKYYRLTGTGEVALAAEARRMASGAQAAVRRLAARRAVREAPAARPEGATDTP